MYVDAYEDSSCCAYIGMYFELVVPDGVDYDLYVTSNACDLASGSSTGGTGTDEAVLIYCNDVCDGEDSGFTANIEVSYFSGTSCEDWYLYVYTREVEACY
jgi:hypothetical protein